MHTFNIPTSRLADARSLVSRFARKAAKLGMMPAPELTTRRTFTWFWLCDRDGHTIEGPAEKAQYAKRGQHVRATAMTEIEIVGERPIIAGWRFAAVIEATPAGNILRKSPHFEGELPERFRQIESRCDHCNKLRKRAATFIVHNDAGEFVQVGRSCLGDFTGAASPESWLAACQFELDAAELDAYADGLGGFNLAARAVPVLAFLEMVAASIREHGYTSAAQARDSIRPLRSTGHDVFMGASDKEDSVRSAYLDAVTDDDRKLAADAVAWVHELAEVSDYIHNVRMQIAKQIVDSRSANTLASLVQTYRKHLGMKAERATKLNEHLPNVAVGQRLRSLEVTLVGDPSFSTDYGTTWAMRFEDAQGRTILWRTSSPGDGYTVGDRVRLTGTVKALGEYKGTAQTELTRCVVERVEEVEAAA